MIYPFLPEMSGDTDSDGNILTNVLIIEEAGHFVKVVSRQKRLHSEKKYAIIRPDRTAPVSCG